MKNRICTVFIEEKFKELLSKHKVDLKEKDAVSVWKVIKELSETKVKAKTDGMFISDHYLFECSYSKKKEVYNLILTRTMTTSWRKECCFSDWLKEYFHFVFTYSPSKYVDFNGQLYSQDFVSLKEFFAVVESKEIFKDHMNLYKPIDISYFIDNTLTTNFI